MATLRSATAAVLLVAACGAPQASPATVPAKAAPAEPAPPPGPAAAAPPAPAPSAAPVAQPTGVPAACASPDGVCAPDPAFVKRLCDGAFPDVALALFARRTPFKRLYLRGDVDAWNADGGASPRARLAFDEEVLVLRRRAARPGGVVVGSGTGYLVMRWDGHCYTLDDGELTDKAPPKAKASPLPFRFYAEPTKDALLKSPKVLTAYQVRGRECKGAMSGEVTRACERADLLLGAAVVAEVREGLEIPAPARLP